MTKIEKELVMNVPDLNKYAWYAVGAMLVIYLILVLEDLVEAMRKRDVLVMKVYEGNLPPHIKVIENPPQEGALEIPPLKSGSVTADNIGTTQNDKI